MFPMHTDDPRHRIAIGIEYEGSSYHGWQIQKGSASVQEHLEGALSKVANHKITLIGSGRTDTGVHALGQVGHFDTVAARPPEAWIRGTNIFLPRDIRVRWVKSVPPSFNARGSAIARAYRYVIYCDSISPAIHRKGVTWVYDELEVDKMHEAAQYFIGEHDFSSFRASGCQAKTPHRRMIEISVKRAGKCIFIDVVGNAFLHHMVRNFAGVLIAIGRGKKPVEWAHEVLLAKDRRYAGVTASPAGLYLMSIQYPDVFELPTDKGADWFL